MLARYQKKGGFVQLLVLIEGFGPDKRKKFIDLIREENANWANLIEVKMLSIEKVCSWGPEILREIFSRLNPLTVSLALHGLDNENREKIFSILGFAQSREIKDQFESSKPSAVEISSVFMKIVSEVRGMESQGLIRFEKIEPSLLVDEDVENLLEKSTLRVVPPTLTSQGITNTTTPLTTTNSATVGTATVGTATVGTATSGTAGVSTASPPSFSIAQPIGAKSDMMSQADAARLIQQNQTLSRQMAAAQEEIQLLRATLDQISKMTKVASGFKKVG